jgi:DNA (cytosine-5)-methyltransferase 3A
MKKIYQDVITEHLGVEPIMINSSLLSAQSRHRLYWTNIPNVQQPQDKGLVIKDILEDLPFDEHPKWLDGNFGDRTRGSMVSSVEDAKTNCLVSSMWKGQIPLYIKNPERVRETPNYWQMDVSGKGYASQQDRIRKPEKPSNSLAAGSASIPKVMCGAFRGRYNEEGKTEQQLEIRKDEKTNTITTVQKDNLVVSEYAANKYAPHGEDFADPYNKKPIRGNKSTTLRTNSSNGNMWVKENKMYYRKLTPIECERLQTVPDNYTQGVSNTQRYKMLGNGWTVDVIAHILKNINEENSHTLQTERTPTRDTQRSQEI